MWNVQLPAVHGARIRNLAIAALAASVFVINPAFLVSTDPEFTYGEREMNAALTGTWTATIHHETPVVVTFRIEQAKADPHASGPGFVSDAAACGSRTFVASANACGDLTRMPLTLVALDASARTLGGEFLVAGTTFRHGELRITIDDAYVNAKIEPDGSVIETDHPGISLVHVR